MKEGISQKTTEKYLKALRAFKLKCDNSTIKNASTFARDHEIPSKVFSILKEKGVIHKDEMGYIWTSIPPNIHMAKQVQTEMLDYNKRKLKERGKNLPEKPLPMVEKPLFTPDFKEEHLESIQELESKRVTAKLINSLSEQEIKRKVVIKSTKSILWGLYTSGSTKRETEYK